MELGGALDQLRPGEPGVKLEQGQGELGMESEEAGPWDQNLGMKLEALEWGLGKGPGRGSLRKPRNERMRLK